MSDDIGIFELTPEQEQVVLAAAQDYINDPVNKKATGSVLHPNEVGRRWCSDKWCPHGCHRRVDESNTHCCSNPYIDHLWAAELHANGYDWRTEKSQSTLVGVKKSLIPRSERFNETVTEVENQIVRGMVPYRMEDAGIVKLSGLVLATGTVRAAASAARGVSGFCGKVAEYYQ